MLLSNVTEPGGMLRRRNRGDELGMRQLFDQEDLIAAEVQRISPEGTISLHSRGTEKYGRLSGAGQFVQVRASLVKRAKHQFFTLVTVPVSIILGMNGYIWISGVKEKAVDGADRSNITRVANCITVLGIRGIEVYQKTIEAILDNSLSMSLSLFDILSEEHHSQLVANVSETTTKRVKVDYS
ncbi:exosome complex component RRP4 [Strigomonas culicis]|nr:exosome complex component RRP4 [Strigomonas culicis]|eukprot:EPY35805.1 exosome complex component RRP4 [Strigomonas culicis]